MRSSWRALALACAITALAPAAASASTYIVMLKAPPLASYEGGTKSLRATSPQGDDRLSTTSAAAKAYRSYLASRQAAALARVPGETPDVIYDYRLAFSGFAADMTAAQAEALRQDPEVAQVFKNEVEQPQSDPAAVDAALGGPTGDGASYLGLPKGLWNTLGGPDHAGEDVIVGVIDTGITPQHPSFADRAAGSYIGPDYGPVPARWRGSCDAGPDPKGFVCNRKLIGARWFANGFGSGRLASGSFLSPRDDQGHGTHTASTAAGNYGVNPAIGTNDLGIDVISGIAPRARIAMYKACWISNDGNDGCFAADLVAAIDQAVADGVDVINYSIGGATSSVLDTRQYALLGATDAGIYVATSAGNNGPNPSTIGTPTSVPWVTTVAAETSARTFAATAHITPSSGPAFDVTAPTLTGAVSTPTQVVDARAGAAPGASASNAELCFPGTLDPAKVGGKIVLCLRGTNARVEKSQVVGAAGGVGMIFYNASDEQDVVNDIHYVPTVHISNTDGRKVKSAIAAGTTLATIGGGATAGTPRVLAPFSSRGPQSAVPDLPKPDLTAPGVNTLAGWTPDDVFAVGAHGNLFQMISGTSMASPHVAGAGALLRSAHPTWSPAEIKSALMTTASPSVLKEDGTTPATPFDQGSGELDPTKANDPGLVLDESALDYKRYVNHQLPGTFDVGAAPSLRPNDLNLASIGDASASGSLATTRTFRSVASSTTTWNATVSVAGFDAAVSPASFTIAPGATQALGVTATQTTASRGQFTHGALVLTDGTRTLRLPISLRPVAFKAPAVSITVAQTSGSRQISVPTGYDGSLTAVGWGLAAPGARPRQTVSTDADGNPSPAADGPTNRVYDVTAAPGTRVLSGRISNTDGDYGTGLDLDLYVYFDADRDGQFASGEYLTRSVDVSAGERITLVSPAAGDYRFVIVGYATASPTSYDFTTWVGGDGAPAGLSVTGGPFAATAGGTVRPTLNWSNVNAPGLYLGVVTYRDGTAELGTSVVELDRLAHTATEGVISGTVPATLGITLGAAVTLGHFSPGAAATYSASTTASVTSTAGDASLAVTDPSATAPGRLVNGAFALASRLEVRATDAQRPAGLFGALGAAPLSLLSYAGPVTNGAVTIAFRQPISPIEPLRTGAYGKTLTFTLSTTNP